MVVRLHPTRGCKTRCFLHSCRPSPSPSPCCSSSRHASSSSALSAAAVRRLVSRAQGRDETSSCLHGDKTKTTLHVTNERDGIHSVPVHTVKQSQREREREQRDAREGEGGAGVRALRSNRTLTTMDASRSTRESDSIHFPAAGTHAHPRNQKKSYIRTTSDT